MSGADACGRGRDAGKGSRSAVTPEYWGGVGGLIPGSVGGVGRGGGHSGVSKPM